MEIALDRRVQRFKLMSKSTTKADAWNRFVKEGLIDGEESNVSHPFRKLSKLYGLAYIDYLQAAWAANADSLTVAEFCAVNGEIPAGFFAKKVAL